MLAFNPVYEEISKQIDQDSRLIRLFRTALYAIREEEASLARAVSQAPPEYAGFYGTARHGLGYWVFETDIIHAIYKSWLSFVPVAWEKRNPEAPGQIDLVVYDPDPGAEGGYSASLICEAKWWMDNSAATRRALAADFKAMERWRHETEKRVLIGLWYWDADALEPDSMEAMRLRDEIHRHMAPGDIEMLYLGAFPTDFATVSRPENHGYFCMGFFRRKQ